MTRPTPARANDATALDEIDRAIVNALQGGFPISDRPYAEAAATLDLSEQELIDRLAALLARGALTRFGPLYNAERMGGALTLAAMSVPEESFDDVAAEVNGWPEVAHNYARGHRLNMWFVLATESAERIPSLVAEIERKTGCKIYDFPKLDEYFIGLKFDL